MALTLVDLESSTHMSDIESLSILADSMDLSEATRDLVAHGDVLEYVDREVGGVTRFRSRTRNAVIEVPKHLLRSLYFRAYSEEITIEG